MSFSLEEIDCANSLVFTDSPYFWNGLLGNLPNNLGKNGDVLDLGKEKGLYSCGCMNSFEKFSESLPRKFCNSLTTHKISDRYYKHASKGAMK